MTWTNAVRSQRCPKDHPRRAPRGATRCLPRCRRIQQRDEARAKVGQLQLRCMELRRSILEVRQAVSCIGLALAAGNMRKAADLIEK